MSESLSQFRDVVNQLFDVLEVLLVRILLLALAGLGAWGLVTHHP